VEGAEAVPAGRRPAEVARAVYEAQELLCPCMSGAMGRDRWARVVAGGCTQSFHRPGFGWDVGVHYIGLRDESHQVGRLFDGLTERSLEWNDLPEIYDRVPMNHSNKDMRSSAESEEGRPLIKENAGQSNTCPTQSGKGVSQGLAGVRKAAREHKEMKFTALLHHLTVDLLRESVHEVSRRAVGSSTTPD
jgi:hypothetical protein